MAKRYRQSSKRGQIAHESNLKKIEKATRQAAQDARKAKRTQRQRESARRAKKTARQWERRFARRITNQANQIEDMIKSSAARFAARSEYVGGWLYEYQLASIRRYGSKTTVERMQRTLLTRIGYAAPADVQGVVNFLLKHYPNGGERLANYLVGKQLPFSTGTDVKHSNINAIDGSLLQKLHDDLYSKPPMVPADEDSSGWQSYTTQFISANRQFQSAAKKIRSEIYKIGK